MNTNLSDEQRKNGVIGMLDGAAVIKVPAARVPAKFGFIYGHRSATIAPTKLNDYKVHEDPPGLSGSLVEGRVCYDAFVLENKATALYYQATV